MVSKRKKSIKIFFSKIAKRNFLDKTFFTNVRSEFSFVRLPLSPSQPLSRRLLAFFYCRNICYTSRAVEKSIEFLCGSLRCAIYASLLQFLRRFELQISVYVTCYSFSMFLFYQKKSSLLYSIVENRLYIHFTSDRRGKEKKDERKPTSSGIEMMMICTLEVLSSNNSCVHYIGTSICCGVSVSVYGKIIYANLSTIKNN